MLNIYKYKYSVIFNNTIQHTALPYIPKFRRNIAEFSAAIYRYIRLHIITIYLFANIFM